MSAKTPRKTAREAASDKETAARATRRLVEMPEPQIATPRSDPAAPTPPPVESGPTVEGARLLKRPKPKRPKPAAKPAPARRGD